MTTKTHPPTPLAVMEPSDLALVSAHLQDAIVRPADMVYHRARHRFTARLNRFCWECVIKDDTQTYMRTLCMLSFDGVMEAKRKGFAQDAEGAFLHLLALRFTPEDAPGGVVLMIFAGGGEVRLSVEALDARLCDEGMAWSTDRCPSHAIDSSRMDSSQ